MESNMLLVFTATVVALLCLPTVGAFADSIAAELGGAGLSFNYTPLSQHTAPFLMSPMIGDVLLGADSIELTASSNTTLSGFQNLAGRLFHSQRLQLWNSSSSQTASFNCSFSFHLQQYNGSEYSSDGLAFLLVRPDAAALPPGSFGAWLGLFNSSTNYAGSSNQLLAVEFDTFQNGLAPFFDTSPNHIGIDVNSINSTLTQNNLGFALYNTTTFAWIDYHSPSSTLYIYATNKENAKPVTPQLSFQEDLSQILPEQVLLGFSAGTGVSAQRHTLLSWSFSTTYHFKSSSKGVSNLMLVEIIVPVAAVIIVFTMFVVRLLRKHGTNQHVSCITAHFLHRHHHALGKDHEAAAVLRSFSYKELAVATNNFSGSRLLGKGGFGSVYKGVLCDARGKRTEEIAVKCLAQDAGQGEKEFHAELSIISRIRHRNLVQLKGWCRDNRQLMLVYQFMPNGSLDYHLYPTDEHAHPSLDCPTRFRIMCGVGSVLQYFHEECETVILHRDLKPSNVMLDSDYSAKLGDFGLARQLKEGAASHTTMLAGTRGYIAPECAMSRRITVKGDVYSYGAMLLEVACGRHPVDERLAEEYEGQLVNWVWSLYSSDQLHEAMHPHLSKDDEEVVDTLTRMMIVGLACLHPDKNSRPKISEALGALLGRYPMLTIPVDKPYCPPNYRALSNLSSNATTGHALTSPSTFISASSIDVLKCQVQDDLALMTWPR